MRVAKSSAIVAFGLCFRAVSGSFNSALNRCPEACGDNTADLWTMYNKVQRLEACVKPMLLDFAVHKDIHDPSTVVKMHACTVDDDLEDLRRSVDIKERAGPVLCMDNASPYTVTLDVGMSGDGSNWTYATANSLASVESSMSTRCNLKQTFGYSNGAVVGVFSGPAVDNGGTIPSVLAAAIALVNNTHFGAPEKMFVQRCVKDIQGSTDHIFGVAVDNSGSLSWVQQAIQTWGQGACLDVTSLPAGQGVASNVTNISVYEYTHPAGVLKNLTNPSNSTSYSISSAIASYSSAVLTSSSSIEGASSTSTPPATSVYPTPPGPIQTGIINTCNRYAIVAAGQGCYDFAAAYGITLDSLYLWNPAIGACANLWLGEAYCVGVSTAKRNANFVELEKSKYAPLELEKRADCTTVKVASGDSCGTLTIKCGISSADFTKYNPATDLCSTLAVGEVICCSAGTLPDLTPKPNPDGTCFPYTVTSGDTCSSIGAAYSLTIAKIESFNNGTTWGWYGCGNLLVSLNICLSTGLPPMPNAVTNALCGPTVPGTMQPTNGTALADLNQCPLNACCNVWGQCGITPDYCTNSTGPAKNPGTAPPNQNGCISNCGTSITNSNSAPAQFISVGYYESWNYDRPCLNMRAAGIDSTVYTHIHWAFATISDSYDVIINDTYKQWDDFKALPVKRIVSFGGWGYSTDAATYNRLRQAMIPANRLAFVNNIIAFLNKEGIDGVDFDWEYPGAPDIPGIPAGLPTDGQYYFEFLGALRGSLGSATSKSISFAVPASYWYLQHFPISQMAGEADYIVYMTYDLHGQWDYGNQWSQDGCSNGDCLRSHVNLTETMYTLAMITKANVPTNKITVGVSSYGRSFGMTKAGCTGPMCTYGGPDSTAAEGECTQTAGYISNAEILDIFYANDTDEGMQAWYDGDTDSNYLVYNQTQWVAYMTDDVKNSRKSRWKGLNFAGTVDWAVDLAQYTDDDGDPDGDCSDCDDNQTPNHPWTPCNDKIGNLDDLSDDTINNWPVHCSAQYLLQALGSLLTEASTNFTDLMSHDYDSKFNVYAKSVAGSSDSQVHQFMMNHGNDYFTCVITEFQLCCSGCSGSKEQCQYCFDGPCNKRYKRDMTLDEKSISPSLKLLEARGDYDPTNNLVPITKWENTTQPCPPDYSARGYGPSNPYEQTVYWTLNPAKKDAFFADLLNSTGIPSDKIGFGLYTDIDTCSGHGFQVGDGAECWNNGYEFGAPFPNGYGAADVTNPKALVQKGLTNSANLPDQIDNIVLSMQALAYPDDGFKVVDAVSLPIMMIAQGVESMQLVVQTADKIEEEERKAIILAFIGAILFFVPIAGEVLGAVTEMADVTAILNVLGAIGNAAMDVVTIVSDKDNAPLAIVDLIMAPLALADVAIITQAAEIRRGMSVEDLAKLGGRVGERMKKLEKVTGVCIKSD